MYLVSEMAGPWSSVYFSGQLTVKGLINDIEGIEIWDSGN